MNIKNYIHALLLCVSASSCYNGKDLAVMYNLDVNAIDYKQKPIENWYVIGTFNPSQEIVSAESFEGDVSELAGIENPDTLNRYWYNGAYSPKYHQLDLREVFDIKPSEKYLIDDKTTFLACDIQSNKEKDLFIKARTSMELFQYMNGEPLQRKEIQGLHLYPVHLTKGNNRYVVKTIAKTDDLFFESTVLDGESVASVYVNGQSNNIIIPEVSPETNTISYTNEHHNLFTSPVKILFHDVEGKKVHEIILRSDSVTNRIPSLKKNYSYMCTMTVNGQTVRQPFVYGSFDQTFERLQHQRMLLSDAHSRAREIDQIIYRLGFLLKHETRKTDWWWQFKIAPLTYQLDLIFANLDGEHGKDKGEFNIQFITYTSELDNGVQRYLLATPNKMEKGKKYPLVVVVRPHVENHYHFFTSPQFAHQWAINIMQSLANSHGFIVMMPEARMYHEENLTPFIEAEMKLAIEDVKKHYNVDDERIYLHGICSGGYRALRMATENPNMFAAIGLYTPSYHESMSSDYSRRHSLETMLPNLAGTPIMLFADPHDKHTPYQVYGDLIEDCKKYNIPLTFSQKINTEFLYNAVVVGEEAFDFFDGKKRNRQTVSVEHRDEPFVVLDFYSQPFTYVYNSHDHSTFYRTMVEQLKKDYRDYLYTELPLIADTEIDETMLSKKNLFLIGDAFTNPRITKLVRDIKEGSPLLQENVGNSLSVHSNTLYPERKVILSTYMNGSRYFRYPWISGTERSYNSNLEQ